MKYTLSELSEKTKVSARTIRYWIAERIIDSPVGKGHGAYYIDKHLEDICRVKEKQSNGKSLSEIKSDDDSKNLPLLRKGALNYFVPIEGVTLLLDNEVSPHHRKIFIDAVLEAARIIDKKGELR